MSNDSSYDVLVKATTNFSYRVELAKDADAVLAKEGITDINQTSTIKGILVPLLIGLENMNMPPKIVEAQLKEQVEHYEVLSELRIGLTKTIDQMLTGFNRTMLMYTISFYLGVLMIVLAAIFAIFKGETLLPIVFAGLGTADMIGHFITNPPLKLEKSRADLAQLQAAYFTWYQDFRHWQGFLVDAYNKKYALGFMQTSEYIDVLRQVSDALMHNTQRTLSTIEKFAEAPDKTADSKS